jgi:hypothetical protein
MSAVTYRLMRPDRKLLRQIVHVDRLKRCPSTLHRPTEFITLHPNDSFDPKFERDDKLELPDYGPVIVEKSKERKEKEEILNTSIELNNFVDIPYVKNQPTWQRYENEFNKLISEDEAPNTHLRIPIVQKKVQRLLDQKARQSTPKAPEEIYDDEIEHHQREPQFYDAELEKPHPLRFAEFPEVVHEPIYKTELFHALKRVLHLYNNLPSETDVAPIKKTLTQILSTPNVSDNDRMKYFRKQVAKISDYNDLIDFLRNCLIHFVDVFRHEIEAEKRN